MTSLLAVLLAGAVGSAPAPADRPSPEATLRLEVSRLQARTARERSDPRPWNELAMAWRRLARLTGEASYDDKAWAAVQAALQADPRDPEALAVRGWVQAARHDFEGAVVSAQAAIAARPDDSWSYGVLADALTELGRYAEAVRAVEKMMALKPGIGAYSRAAHLRGLHGDREGAIGLMKMAVEAASPADPEGLAWTRVMLGREHQACGEHTLAREQYRRALLTVPGYHLALFHLAESYAATGEAPSAVFTLERLHAASPSAVSAAALGGLYEAQARAGRAASFYKEVDVIAALKDPSKAEPRWLARFYADRGRNLDESIALVREELKTHQDIETWDGLAWALHRAGRHQEALAASDKARALGTVDARLLYHRGMIERAAGHAEGARSCLEQALKLQNLWPWERQAAERALREVRAARP